MKRFLLIAVLAVLSLPVSSDLRAQTSDFYVRINGTTGFPISPEQFRERYESALGGGVTVGYLLFTGIELTADVSLQRYLVKDDSAATAVFDRAYTDGSGPFYGGDALFLTGMLGGRFHLTNDSPISGHLLLEAGFQRVSTTTETVQEQNNQTRIPGTNEISPIVSAGVGTMITLTRNVGVYAQASYNVAFADETMHYVPVKAGLIFRVGSTNW